MSAVCRTHNFGLRLDMRSIDPEDFSSRPGHKRIASYLPALIILGLASTVLIFLLTMQGAGWQPPYVFPGPTGFPALLGGTTTTSSNAVLYVSPNTQAYFSRSSGNYDVLLNPWRKYAASRHLQLKEIADIQSLAALKNGTLVLPSALALDDAERKAIKNFREQGGAVLSTWATGSRNGQGDWAGWEFLASLGSKVLGEMEPEPVAGHLILNGESPVSHSHAAGLRIWLGKPAEHHLRMLPIQPEAQVAGRFMNWARIPIADRINEGAVIFSESSASSGRAVVLGFAESAWDANEAAIHTMLDDAFNWLARKPHLIRANWPNGLRSAQIIEMDTEDGFASALRFAAMMNTAKYRGSFYLLSSVAKQYPDVVQALGRDFELGFHGDIHVSFKDQSVADQQARIETMTSEIAAIYPDISKATGFRAPTEGYDQNTEKLLVKNGIRYHVADPSRSEDRLPILVRQEGVLAEESFVVLPRTQRDDINLAQEGLTGERLLEALEQDLALSTDMAALGLLSIHSQNYGSEHALTQAMPSFLGKLTKRPDIWPASGEQVAHWWRDKERFKVKIRHFSTRIEFDVTVIGNKPFQGGALIIMLPARDITPEVQEVKSKMAKPRIQPIDAFRSAIVFDELPPGNYNYQLTFKQK